MASVVPPTRPIVLVVEDEPVMRIMAVDMVEDAGFEAVEAFDSDQAVQILETRPDIRVVFTDIDMPGSMDGMKLAAAIRDRWPPIHVIVTSGYRHLADVTLPADVMYFPKPYSHELVVAAMHQMAARAGQA